MLTIEIDGNDGTGKTYLINSIREYLFNNFNYNWKLNRDIVYEDRGLLSVATLSNEWEKENPDITNICKLDKENTLYILIDDIPEKCQERILARGDSIEEEYHTLADLQKYRDRFNKLKDTFSDIIYIQKNGKDFTDDVLYKLSLLIIKKHNLILRNELIKVKAELDVYKKQYSDIDINDKYICVTEINLQKILIKVSDIIKCSYAPGIFNGVHYNTKIVCKDQFYYVIESYETVRELIKKANLLE